MKLKMTHPHTGEPIKPVYVWRDGRVSWPVMGASPDDPSNSGTGDGVPEGGTVGDGGTGTPAESTGEADKPVSREEFARLQQHLSEADKKRTAAEAKLKEIEDGKKDELTKATEKVAELEKSNATKDSELTKLRLQNAFLSVNGDDKVEWHDPEEALGVAERNGYLEGVVKDDGKVDSKALGKKLKELAAAKAYLVKKGTEEQQTPPPSGGAVGSGSKGNTNGAPEEAALKSRYRTLR